MQIIPKWTDIDVDEALELLGPSFDNPVVRAYAVDRLRKADDEVELIAYPLPCIRCSPIGLGTPSLFITASAGIKV